MEKNAQLLANRIEHLKNEEVKLWKKIRSLHTSASQIENLKLVNEDRKKEKEIIKKKMDEMYKTKGSVGFKGKHETMKNLERKKELLEFQKMQRVEQLKEERVRNEKIFRIKKVKQERENILKKNEVARKESQSMLKKEEFFQQKKDEVLYRIRQEKLKEKQVIFKYKKELGSLCRQENEWMDKLRNSQKIQNKVYNKLIKVLNAEEQVIEQKQEDLEQGDGPKELNANEGSGDGQRREAERESLHSKASISDQNMSIN